MDGRAGALQCDVFHKNKRPAHKRAARPGALLAVIWLRARGWRKATLRTAAVGSAPRRRPAGRGWRSQAHVPQDIASEQNPGRHFAYGGRHKCARFKANRAAAGLCAQDRPARLRPNAEHYMSVSSCKQRVLTNIYLALTEGQMVGRLQAASLPTQRLRNEPARRARSARPHADAPPPLAYPLVPPPRDPVTQPCRSARSSSVSACWWRPEPCMVAGSCCGDFSG